MADNTRMRDMNQRLDTMEQQFAAAESVRTQQHLTLQDSQNKLQEAQTQQNQQLALLRQDIHRILENQANGPGVLGAGPFRNQNNPGLNRTQPTKITFPRFAEGDPTDWIFCANRYFEFYQIPEAERVLLASFNLDKPANSWFQGLFNDGLIPNWAAFVIAVQRRFGPSEFEDPAVCLANLKQNATVSDFQASFEVTASKVPGLSPTLKRALFVAGLKPHIRRQVLIQQPQDVHSAFSLAKIYEDNHTDASTGLKTQRQWTPRSPFAQNTTAHQPPSSKTTLTTPTLPIKRLSPEEIQRKREQGLCYSCDEKYVFGHRCKGKATLLYFEGTEDDYTPPPQEEPPDSSIPDNNSNSFSEISLNALFGHYSPRSFRLTGTIFGKSVQVLIDGGSTQNFITHKMATYLGLTLQALDTFNVQVGNGEGLQCKAICKAVPLIMQSHTFTLDLYSLELKGADIVLGIQWLSTLGPILTDYSQLSMNFDHNGNNIQLQGHRPDNPILISSAKLNKLLVTDSYTSCLMCFNHTPSPIPSNPTAPDTLPHHPITAIHKLLNIYKDVFTIPHTLPPNRPYNHHINLLPNTKPVQVRPYRYPHFQKSEIEKLCQEMLSAGIIRPSQSPFSSLVLLVKKKDGTWRFCVDYRALNAITVRDQFPIPTVDELLDELHGATVFSKLDLRSGYHQIRMHPEDIYKTAFRTHHGHFEFMVLPFGLSNVPSTFQATMNEVFASILRRFVVIFFDDILVFSPTLQTHVTHLCQVLDILRKHQLYAKLSKCSFATTSIHFLGHIVFGK
ncbi:uncharacterized protein LOC133303598 [Gastrolobium bilobum]|uniref:uncharacterized protein LOC133303598 n=1 Tax=Gastrolobium bilobum TaxID=150636 RepID=UPI002AB2E697|nr:uncharacterized protein LOC133303598 [Gastrolobium bilobum]